MTNLRHRFFTSLWIRSKTLDNYFSFFVLCCIRNLAAFKIFLSEKYHGKLWDKTKWRDVLTWTVEPSDWKIIQFSHFRFDYLYLAIVLFISNVYKSPHARNSIPTIITEKSAKATQNQLKRDFFPANFMILLKRKNRNGRSNFNFLHEMLFFMIFGGKFKGQPD